MIFKNSAKINLTSKTKVHNYHYKYISLLYYILFLVLDNEVIEIKSFEI